MKSVVFATVSRVVVQRIGKIYARQIQGDAVAGKQIIKKNTRGCVISAKFSLLVLIHFYAIRLLSR